jgi:hypothetical protein
MKFLTKSLLSAGAAAAAMVSVAVPAQARHGDRDQIDAGDVIAGALIIGGLAAVLSGNDGNRGYDDRGYDDRGYDNRGYDNRGYDRHGRHRGGNGYGYGYNSNGGGRQAVNMCVNAVENWANRYSRSDVTEIRDIDRTRYGYRVTGKLVVQDGWRGRDRGGDRGYDRYDRDDRYSNRGRGGYDRGYARGYDQGRFTCYVERGRVIDVDYSGLDQWR